MISLVVAAVLLLIHALVCLVLWTLMKLGLLPVRGHMLAVMVLVPLWGPLLVVLLITRSAVFGADLKDATLESLRINDELHRSILVHDREADAGVIPLEEALIVNDPADRRRLMLSMLTEEPDAYLAQLQAAKLNDDVEVAHYAATAVAQISKESDLKLQQLERAFKTDPSAQNLDEYCDFLGEYLDSGLAEGRVAQIQRQQYARLLARRCEREDTFELLPRLEREGHPYDFIILDPPAFTKSGKTVKNAERGYKEINYRAMKALPRGGYLATCSCSHFMTDALFRKMLQSAASDAQVELRLVEARAQGPDHPVLWNVPETDYLKFYIFQVV